MELVLYISFTGLGVLGKLWALTVVKKSWKRSVLYVLTAIFIGLFLAQSTFELMLYLFSEVSIAGKAALIGYYMCAITIISMLPFIIAKLARYEIHKFILRFAIALNAVILFLLGSSSLIIAGVDHTGIALTRIAGEYYWLFQITVLGSIIYTLFILIKCRKTTDGFLKVRTNNILLSFSLFAAFIIFIIITMQFTDGINAVGILPIFITLFVMGIVDNICNKHIVDYSYWLPFSKKRREINKLIKPFIEIQSDGLDPELKKEYNKMITQHALELFDGNQTKAAEWLKVSQSWVSRNNKND